MRHWKVALTIRVIAHIDAPDDWDDPVGIGEIGHDAVSLTTHSTGVMLEVDTMNVDGVIEVDEGPVNEALNDYVGG